jgi:integrase
LVQRITALRLYFEYLVEEVVRRSSPVFRRGTIQAYGSAIFRTPGPIRRLHKLPWIPTDEEWQRVLQATSEDCVRDRAMLALAYDGALRREELCRVSVSDFDFARKLLTIRLGMHISPNALFRAYFLFRQHAAKLLAVQLHGGEQHGS